MIIECAWCSSIVGQKDGLGATGVTSGICDECFEAIYADISAAEGVPAPGCADGLRAEPQLSLRPEPRDAGAACALPAAALRSTRSRR